MSGQENNPVPIINRRVAPIQTTLGVPSGSTNLGAFAGSTIPNNLSVKSAIQSIELALEAAASGSEQHTHTQLTPALVWIVSHNLGKPIIDSVNVWVGGRKVFAEIAHIDGDTLHIRFAIAQSGHATVEG